MKPKEISLQLLHLEIQTLEEIAGTYPYNSTEHFVLSNVIVGLQRDYLEMIWEGKQ